jgi:hypothetical protein
MLLRSLLLAAFATLTLAAAALPARAWDDHDRWRRHEWREHEWREHHAPAWGYGYAPAYRYAPPAYYVAPPPPRAYYYGYN